MERIYEHPFLKDLAAGTLTDERLACYFEQNIHYHDTAVKCRSIATAKAHNNEIRNFFLGRTPAVVEEMQHQTDMLAPRRRHAGRPDRPHVPGVHPPHLESGVDARPGGVPRVVPPLSVDLRTRSESSCVKRR